MIDPHKELKNKTVLVTGGAGFIGSHLCDHLLDYGAKTICFDNLSTGNKEYAESKKGDDRFTFILGDANKMSDIEDVFSKFNIDYVFHYAAVVGVIRTAENPMAVLNDLEGVKNIAKLSVDNKVKKIVYASSSEVYGKQKELPFHEEASYYDTRHPYALVKATGENYLKSYCELSGVPTTSLRFFNVYGPRQTSSVYGFVVGIFISQVLRDMHPTIFRDGTQTRDFTYIDDNIKAAIQVLLNKKTDEQVLNIGTGVELSILDLAKKIISISGKKLEPKILRHINLDETQRRVADNSKLKELTGYEHKVSSDFGLEETFKWYKDNPQFMLQDKQMDYDSYESRVWKPKTE